MVTIKSKKEIEYMKEACKVVALMYKELEEKIKPGMTTWELDQIAENMMKKLGAIPAEKGYNVGIRGVPPYPAATCISVNDEVIHGIPSKNNIIKDGDIVSVDTVALKNGYNGDAARTFMVGNVSKEAKRLVEVTKQAFFEGIKYAKAGNHLNDISAAVQAYAEKFGYGVVRDLVGHGIGEHLHEDPEVPNFARRRKGIRLQAGMTLAVEPMINVGRPGVRWLDDEWTVVTEDGSLSAHYENTILVGEDGPEILSLLPSDEEKA